MFEQSFLYSQCKDNSFFIISIAFTTFFCNFAAKLIFIILSAKGFCLNSDRRFPKIWLI